jgi:phosphatidylglycerol:prolipoprotein diacylglycerol transferase
MLPYYEIPPLKIPVPFFGTLPIYPFGVLVATAVLVGSSLANKRSLKLGLDDEITEGAAGYAIVVGFITAHLYSAIGYFPERIAENPLYLFKVWDGISSFGGFIGGMCAVIYYLKIKRKVSFWAYGDAIMYGWAVSWIFGRLGCTVAFDHPGSLTTFFLGMPYPGDAELTAGVRHNLGFYEALWAMAVSLLFYTQRNKKHFWGWYLITYGMLYTPFRFGLDFLRAVDKRYAGLTPGQYAAILMFGLTVYAFIKRRGADQAAEVLLDPLKAKAAPAKKQKAKKR